MSAVLQQIHTPEGVHDELRDFRHDTNEKFQVLQSQLDVISDLTITHVKECDARKPAMDELLKEARNQKIWREVNSKKMSTAKKIIVYTFAVITGASTLIASLLHIIGVIYG